MIQQIAQILGTYALPIFAGFVLVTLLLITLLWRLFEWSYRQLWAWVSQLWHVITYLPPVQWLWRRSPGVWSFLGRRLAPREYLGLHLTLGLLIILIMLNFFADIADEVMERTAIARFDQALALSLYDHATPAAVTAFQIITHLGDPILISILGVVVGGLLLVRRHWYLLAGWILALAGGGLLNTTLKNIFQRTRPEFSNPFLVETTWSFPSGHAMGSLIAYGMLAYLLVLFLERHWDWLIIAGAVTLVLLIGFSRMYLGVHFFSDVVAGFSAGAAWLVTCITGVEVARRHHQRRRRLEEPRLPQPEHGYRSG